MVCDGCGSRGHEQLHNAYPLKLCRACVDQQIANEMKARSTVFRITRTVTSDERLCLRSGCDNPLTGKQRKWCSEACRKREARTRTRTRQLQEQRPQMSANYGSGRGYVGKKSSCSLLITFEAIQTEPYLDPYDPETELRDWSTVQLYRQMLEKLANEAVIGHRVTVKIVMR